MVSIKIQCGCGQRYEFDVEPAGNSMPYAIACPSCGVDGTPAANSAIAQSLPPEAPVAIPAKPSPLRIATPTQTVHPLSASTSRHSAIPPVDYAQAEFEIQARVLWGDSHDEVIKFAMLQGLSHSQAVALVGPMFAERAATIRRNGIGKIVFGSILVLVPIVSYMIFAHIGLIPMKIFAVTIMVGLYGLYLLIRGIIMVVAPKSEPGNVAEQ